MRRLQPFGALLLFGALSLFVATPGCKKGEEQKGGGDGKTDGGKSPTTTKLEMIEPKEWGSLTGTVTYDGDPGPLPDQKMTGEEKVVAPCHSGAKWYELKDQTWLVNKDKGNGVADVMIYLKAPKGKFFKVHDEYFKQVKEKPYLEVHQPHCAFIPHTMVHWAEYRDKDGKLKPSGQKIKVTNEAPFDHNFSYQGDPDIQPKGNAPLPGKKGEKIPYKDLPAFKADLKKRIEYHCDIHKWMTGQLWALDTPYCARTDLDGKFTIPHVPAGTEVYIVAWHEGAGYFLEGGANGQKKKLEKGENTLNLKVKKK